MVENLCRAFFHDARQTKATNGTGAKRRGTTFAVRRDQNARQTGVVCRAPPGKTHGKHRLFAVRLPKNARQTGPFAVRHHKKRTANIF
jgi:hypothetical protein